MRVQVKIRKRRVLCILAAAVFLFSAVQATLAAWKVSDPSIHTISVASLGGRIVGSFDDVDDVNDVKAGQVIDRVVNVRNTGSSDSVIRMEVEKAWGKGRTPEGVLIPDDSYSTDNILINYNTVYWLFNEEDGYFYYKGVLKPGETTIQPLFESFQIAPDTGEEYNALTADITVKLECIQAAANAIQVWNMSFERLGITYDEAGQPVNDVAEVNFIGKNDGFAFHRADADLFSNFKDLLPGETRNQTIRVTNSSSHSVEIFLRAETMEQTEVTPETLELINRLLKEYVTVIVTAEDGTVIYKGPVCGNTLADAYNPESMRYDISLGSFAAGNGKNLSVQLMINPQVDNQYQALLGKIRWVWSAEGDDYKSETLLDPPKTGDSSTMYIYFGIMLASGLLLILLFKGKDKEKKRNKQIYTKTK